MIPWWELSSAGVILSSMERVGCKPFLATTNFSQWERRQMRTLLVRTTITKIISFPTIYCFFYDTDPAQAARLLRRHGTGMQKHEALQLNQRAPNAENIGENIARFNDLSNSPFTGAMTMENFWNQRLCVLPTHWTWIPQTYNIFSFGLGVCYVSRVLAFRPPLALYFLCVCEAAGRFSSKIRQFPWLGAL